MLKKNEPPPNLPLQEEGVRIKSGIMNADFQGMEGAN